MTVGTGNWAAALHMEAYVYTVECAPTMPINIDPSLAQLQPCDVGYRGAPSLQGCAFGRFCHDVTELESLIRWL